MAGLVDTQIDLEKPLTSIQGYEAETTEVNAPTDTVAGQMDTLLSKESPYITRARTSAAQYSNSRGLVNSSMGAEAGESAAIGAALPIASQDANTYSATRLTNQAAKNRGLEFTAGSTNQGALTAFQANKAAEAQKLAGTQALEQIGASGEQQRLNIGAQTGANLQLMAQEFANQKELTAAQFAQQKAQTILQGEIQQGLLKTEAEQRERLAELQGQIQSALSGQQYQQQLGTMAFGEQINTRMATLESGFAERMATLQANLQAGTILPAQYEIQSKILTQQAAIQRETLALQGQLNQQMERLQADLQTGQIMPAQFEQQKALLDKQLAASITLQAAQQDFSLALQQMKGEQATTLADIEAQYKTLVQTSASAATYFAYTTQALTAVLGDPNTSQEQKDGAVAFFTDQLAGFLAVEGGIADVDLTGLLNFTPA